jgi:hypothetical protein
MRPTADSVARRLGMLEAARAAYALAPEEAAEVQERLTARIAHLHELLEAGTDGEQRHAERQLTRFYRTVAEAHERDAQAGRPRPVAPDMAAWLQAFLAACRADPTAPQAVELPA